MMYKKELPYFHINGGFGGNQSWFLDPWMHIGGCGALTMCDLVIYMTLYKGLQGGYPYDINNLTKHDYRKFGMLMKPYLRPRETGIKDLPTFIDGAKAFLAYSEIRGIEMTPFDGHLPVSEAKAAIAKSIDEGMPVPMLMLKHADRKFDFFEWHWFLITGYRFQETAQANCDDESKYALLQSSMTKKDDFHIQVATYGKEHWLDFNSFWDTGYDERGGLVLLKSS